MQAASENYLRYLEEPDSWALGRFVLPISRLDEFAESAALQGEMEPVHLSGLAGSSLASDWNTIAEFHKKHPRLLVDTIEIKSVVTPSEIPEQMTAYVEVPIDIDPRPVIEALAERGLRAKVRTGGITPDAFPTSADIARFLVACQRSSVPFKATAGLHHPLRGERPLTYESNSPSGTMHGFLNVFLAAAFFTNGATIGELLTLLEETSLQEFRFEEESVQWRDQVITIEELARAREFVVSFGSCSFEEPLSDLRQLGLL